MSLRAHWFTTLPNASVRVNLDFTLTLRTSSISVEHTPSYGRCVSGFMGLNVTVEREEGHVRGYVQTDLVRS